MAAESERPPYLNGASGSKGAKESEVASDTGHRLARGSNDMMEVSRPTIPTQGQAMSQVPKLLPNLSTYSAPTSTGNSAVSSRESSPVRISSRTANSPSTSRVSSQTRKGTPDRVSPTRASSNGQSSARTLQSSSGQRASPGPPTNPPPTLSPPPAPEAPANVPSPEKHNMPPWAGNRRTDQESTPSNTSLKRTSPSPSEEHCKVDRSTPRAATRVIVGQGPSLETVQEMASNPSTPSSDNALQPTTPDDARLHTIDEDPTPRASRHNTESGSDSGGNPSSKEESRADTTGTVKVPGTIMPQRSSTSLSAGARAKPTDGSVRNMIVETETVSSIPQVSLGVATGERGSSSRAEQGTLRMKPSTETIRPRKEKKKSRRANHLTTGPGTSKADIFEAKVASAVDEADVSDSDETFVYESNPPDPYPPRQSRYHSRTPSATSMASQVDQLAGRARGAMRDGSHSVTGKRSMKFTNNTYNSSMDGDAQEADGSRNAGRVEGSGTITPRHHHVGRHGRNGAYPSLFDGDGPFPQPQTQLKSPRHFIGSGYRHSRNSNTRSSPNYKTIANKKAGDVYDFDAEGADDERTPLVGTPRATRSRHGRRPNSASLRQMEYMAEQHRGCFSRYGSCAIILFLLLIVAGGAASFITAATKTLLDVQVVAIQNVLASEQEIMLDLQVEAVNPNIFPVTIDDADVNIFAKSRYVGTESSWQENSSDVELYRTPRVEQSRRRWYLSRLVRCLGNTECVEEAMKGHSKGPSDGGVDKGTDPIGDPEGDPQTMLLGRVFRFDSPLSFEASPWGHLVSTSKGQIRLARPGNKTESGGTERWERVLQHPFDLIVRGVVKYQLPLSSRFHSASISSTVRVIPDDDTHNPDSPDSTPPSNETAPRLSLVRRTTTPSSSVRLIADPDAQPEHQSGVSQRQFTA
ncbi:vacuolar inheritance and morphology protein [Penicillium ochrochloron]